MDGIMTRGQCSRQHCKQLSLWRHSLSEIHAWEVFLLQLCGLFSAVMQCTPDGDSMAEDVRNGLHLAVVVETQRAVCWC